jgi:periplasmic protein TonB
MMTLRSSLSISILCHILIFGCALALARFAGNAIRQGSDVIQVTLVAPGNLEKAARTAQKKKAELVAHDRMTVEEHAPAAPIETMSNTPLPQPPGNAAEDAETGPPTDDPDAGKIGGPQTGQASAEYLGLVEAIERVKKYPRLAREHGMEGVVRLRFMLNRSGGVDAVELVKSSGYEILDSASINAIYRAAPMPYVNGWVEMPMRYVLK